MIATVPRPTPACSTTTPRLRRAVDPNSASLACSSTRCGRTAEDSAASARAWRRCNARRPPAGNFGRGRPLFRRCSSRHRDLDGSLRHIPLKVHARYQREEILAASTSLEAQQLPRGRLVLRGPQRRCLLRDAQEVRVGLLAHHDVPRLPDLSRRSSTGSRSRPRPSRPRRVSATSPGPAHVLIFARHDRRMSSARRRTSSSGRPTMSSTPAIVRSRSPGGSTRLTMDFFAIASAVAQ